MRARWSAPAPWARRLAPRGGEGVSAYVLDGAGRRISGPLQRGGAVLVAEIAPDGKQVATLELPGELTPPPIGPPPGSPPTFGLHPYLFLAGTDGSSRAAVARDAVDTAWIGSRLLRSDRSSQAPFGRGLCLLAVNTGGAPCRLQRSVRVTVRRHDLAVRVCAPAAGRVTVTLTRGGHRIARRTVGGSAAIR